MGGGGKGGSQQFTQADPNISAFAGEVREQSRPVREEIFRQVTEALKTGGVGAQIPLITRAVESTRAATSRALAETEASLGRSRLAGTPFGQRILAETRMGGEGAAALIPTTLAQQFTSVAPNLALGSAGTVIQGLTNAAGIGVAQRQIGAQEAIGEMQMWGQVISALLGAGGSVGAGAALASGCWIAAALYGYGTPEFWSARRFIFDRWRGPIAVVARWLYRRSGQRVARRPWALVLLHPAFDIAVAKGR